MRRLIPLFLCVSIAALGSAVRMRVVGQVVDRSIYPGIDLLIHGDRNPLEYDFRLAPGADPSRVELAFDGGGRPEIDARGDLILHAGPIRIRQTKPIAYQMVNGRRREVAASFQLDQAGHVRFRLGAYDTNRDLVIDPTVLFDNQFGPPYSSASAIALDTQGNIYVAGQTTVHQAGSAGDTFLNKWNPTGNQLIYSINFGGNNGTDTVSGIAVDSAGSAYLIGATGSPNFTVSANAFQKNLIGNRNAFVAKLSADGTHLIYASLLGGGFEQTGGIAVDSSGAAYITGSTFNNFPVTMNAFQQTPDSNCNVTIDWFNYSMTGDAFVAKISPDGGSLVYSSYLGGSCGDYGYGIALNSDGSAWVAGSTFSPDFPVTPDALQPMFGGGFGDGFLAKVSAEGDRITYSTFLGGIDYDQINAVVHDSAGDLYLTGSSAGFSQPATAGAYQPHATAPCIIFNLGPPTFNVDGNAFVMKLDPTGTAITGLTYLGSPCYASGAAIAVDSSDAPWIVGSGGLGFPMAIPLQIQAGGGVISKFSPDLTQLLFSTSFATVNDLALDANGIAYIVGAASPPGITGTGPNVSNQAYVAGIDASPVAVSLDNVLSASPFLAPFQGEILASGKVIRVVGRGIGPAMKTPGVINAGVIANTVAGVRVTFDGVAAPLLYVSSTEIGCIVPYSIAGRAKTTLQVTYNGTASNAVPVPLQASAPEVLEVLNSDFSTNSAANPAQADSIISLYLTGAGQTIPASTDGEVYAAPFPQAGSTISLAGLLPVTFAGAAPGLADGILQVNFQAPPAQPAEFPNALTLSTGAASTNFIVYVK